MEDMRKKAILVSIMVAVICCCVCGCFKKKEDSHRIIQVLETSGTVTVERTDIGAVEAYEGMRLQSGDIISVEQESWLKLQMDEDKYALVEPDSKLRLEAEGSSTDSKTVIHLESGAISNRLESELSDASVYEVNTPNSTMAVRGTVFRVEVSFDEDGVSITNVSVYDGKVQSRLIYPDGTIEDENKAVMIIAGTGVQIWGNDTTSDYVSTNDKNDLKELKLETLYFLKEAYKLGIDLSVSEEELDELIETLEKDLEPAESEQESTEEEMESTEQESTEEEAGSKEPKSTEEEKESTEPGSTEEKTESAESEAADDNSGDSDDSDDSNDSDDDDSDDEEDESEAPVNSKYTVTFMYQGNVFATQTVQKNATASAPKLQPTASGSWGPELSKPITADTTIQWTAAD